MRHQVNKSECPALTLEASGDHTKTVSSEKGGFLASTERSVSDVF